MPSCEVGSKAKLLITSSLSAPAVSKVSSASVMPAALPGPVRTVSPTSSAMPGCAGCCCPARSTTTVPSVRLTTPAWVVAGLPAGVCDCARLEPGRPSPSPRRRSAAIRKVVWFMGQVGGLAMPLSSLAVGDLTKPSSLRAAPGGTICKMDHSFLSALVLLLLVLDPLGSLPIFISVMQGVAPERRRRVALREGVIAFGVLLAFMLGGQGFLSLMRLSERSLEVAGGVILLIIAIRMIFTGGAEVYASDSGREPYIFPLAVPLLAGPSAMATVLLLASRQPERLWSWVGALTLAMAVSGGVLLSAGRIRRALGESMVAAIEKLMGLVLTAVAVEMILAGLKRYFFDHS